MHTSKNWFPIKKKQRADFVGFLLYFFGHQSTPLSAIRPLPARFALFFPYLPTLILFSQHLPQNSRYISSYYSQITWYFRTQFTIGNVASGAKKPEGGSVLHQKEKEHGTAEAKIVKFSFSVVGCTPCAAFASSALPQG